MQKEISFTISHRKSTENETFIEDFGAIQSYFIPSKVFLLCSAWGGWGISTACRNKNWFTRLHSGLLSLQTLSYSIFKASFLSSAKRWKASGQKLRFATFVPVALGFPQAQGWWVLWLPIKTSVTGKNEPAMEAGNSHILKSWCLLILEIFQHLPTSTFGWWSGKVSTVLDLMRLPPHLYSTCLLISILLMNWGCLWGAHIQINPLQVSCWLKSEWNRAAASHRRPGAAGAWLGARIPADLQL